MWWQGEVYQPAKQLFFHIFSFDFPGKKRNGGEKERECYVNKRVDLMMVDGCCCVCKREQGDGRKEKKKCFIDWALVDHKKSFRVTKPIHSFLFFRVFIFFGGLQPADAVALVLKEQKFIFSGIMANFGRSSMNISSI